MTHQEKVELLVRIDERTEQLVKWTERHVELHTRLSLAFLGAAVSAFLALGTTVVSLLILLKSHG